VPFGQGRPKWVDDENFDIRYHVRSTALPRPGGEEELKTLAGRVFSIELNREKPLWEIWLAEGLAAGGFALLCKTHHALVDGVSGLDIMTVLFAPEDADNKSKSLDWRPRKQPSGLTLLVEALLERALAPREAVRPIRALWRGPRQLATSLFETAVGFGALAWAGLAPAPRTPYNRRAVGTNRRFTWVGADLEAIKAIKNELGGTVNDVILTIVTRGLREHLTMRGEDVDGVTLKAFVPVSVRSEQQRGGESLGNKVTGMIAPLPVGCPDPRVCLSTISQAMRELKESGQAVGAQALTELSGLAPGALLHEGARLAARQRLVNLVVTNVPGPQFPLYLGKHELHDIYPMVPLGTNLNLGVAIVSYNGTINFGLVSDFDNIPDLERIADCFRAALAELAETADVAPAAADVDAAASADGDAAAEPQPPPEDATVRERIGLFERTAHVETEEELVESVAERGAEDGAGAEIEVHEPWDGYDAMTAADILDRLTGAPAAAAGLVELYERSHKGRKTVLEAAERAVATAGRS
jgi:diacylglycerol O-acyltransferase